MVYSRIPDDFNVRERVARDEATSEQKRDRKTYAATGATILK